ncbi:HaeIII family restriction endonuclease [Streptococcus sp. 2018037]|nr:MULTISPECIES: HaeIII family restriction endonuclease [Streptococcus]MBM7267638.1 HaeIII family restriction endonuclease [Streptococcus suis]MBY0752487.1 HaeIII family restriction endonuclease [Streptococcus sp. 2018037]
MFQAAKASLNTILKAEPNLSNGQELVTLSILVDKSGGDGDVRDIVFIKGETDWEIGISCKHNHHALKHSRLSNDIDFGLKWLGLPVSNDYFEAIKPVFTRLATLRDETKHLDKAEQHKWTMFENKEVEIYLPVLEAFKFELLRLYEQHQEVPKLLIEYLLGRKDFYKVIAKDKERKTIVQAFNLNDTLSINYQTIRPKTKIKGLSTVLPTRIFSLDYKRGSKNTLELIMDNGWSISFRIHNASSRVEPSLKFDIQLIGIPQSVTNIEEYWED